MDVTESSFQADVVERSNERPVVVDFWADWCQPCKALGPVIEREIAERAGQVELAKVDIDANPGLAEAYGIRSIPAVKAFRNGQVVDEFVGALPAERVGEFLEWLLGQAAEADEAARERIRDVMVAIFQELGQDDPVAAGYRRRLAATIY
jgi:putative thioredoxin